MHDRFYNEATLTLRLRPRTPLLIKSGRSGEEALDPTLPEMSFVRTSRPDRPEPEIFIPGASLRGVLRSHAEKLLRSASSERICDPTQTKRGAPNAACFAQESNTGEEISGARAYKESCYACRVFGNTVLAGRARVGDLYPVETRPLLERRNGVAIDRVTGAVAQGPFELEILTDGWLEGRLTLRNYTLGQLGLLAGTLLDLGDGLLPIGYGKSRGLGRVELRFREVAFRTLRHPEGALVGVGALAAPDERARYGIRANDDALPLDAPVTPERGFQVIRAAGEQADALARGWLELVAGRWVDEVAS